MTNHDDDDDSLCKLRFLSKYTTLLPLVIV